MASTCEEYEESLTWYKSMNSICAVCNQPEADHLDKDDLMEKDFGDEEREAMEEATRKAQEAVRKEMDRREAEQDGK